MSKMPKRTHKYDTTPYQNIMGRQERRYRKAFFYVEKLMQIDPKFKQTMTNINQQRRTHKINEQQAQKQTNQAIEQAMIR